MLIEFSYTVGFLFFFFFFLRGKYLQTTLKFLLSTLQSNHGLKFYFILQISSSSIGSHPFKMDEIDSREISEWYNPVIDPPFIFIIFL